jgi:hypothetical protein
MGLFGVGTVWGLGHFVAGTLWGWDVLGLGPNVLGRFVFGTFLGWDVLSWDVL